MGTVKKQLREYAKAARSDGDHYSAAVIESAVREIEQLNGKYFLAAKLMASCMDDLRFDDADETLEAELASFVKGFDTGRGV